MPTKGDILRAARNALTSSILKVSPELNRYWRNTAAARIGFFRRGLAKMGQPRNLAMKFFNKEYDLIKAGKGLVGSALRDEISPTYKMSHILGAVGFVPWAGLAGEFISRAVKRRVYMKQLKKFSSWRNQPRDDQGRWA